MKTILAISITLLCAIKALAQDFAPLGATWYYTETFFSSGDINFLQIESAKDTVISDKNCHALLKHDYLLCTGRQGEEFVYAEDSVAYFYDQAFDEFQVLFDLKAKKDSSWIIKIKQADMDDTLTVSVDSTDYAEMNSRMLKRLYVTYTSNYRDKGKIVWQYTSQIIETIGDIQYLFNIYPWWSGACDENYPGGLRCYNDPNLGSYETGIAESCDYTQIFTKSSQKEGNTPFTIYPNPATDQVKLDSHNNLEYSFMVTDQQGRKLQGREFLSAIQIDLSGYAKGIYFVTVRQSGQVVYTKKIVKD
jgi:hypothetical protein